MYQTWISEGSQLLFTATEKLAYIEQVSILLPSTWTSFGAAVLTDDYAYSVRFVNYLLFYCIFLIITFYVQDSDIVVDVTGNPLYNSEPYSEPSTTECGQRGT